MENRTPSPPAPRPATSDRPLWLAYAGLCLLCWSLYGVAGTDWQRGSDRLWDALYEATWNLGPPMLLGVALLPWTRLLQRQAWPAPARLLAHLGAALAFALLWHGLDFVLSWWFFGIAHAGATLEQRLVWRTAWAVLVYIAMVLGFNGALQGRRAQASAVAAAQAEAGLVRAELAAITGKLNPHFFFNTLNSLHFLLRKDAGAAEASLLRFARMMRYLLDSRRGAADRVPLQDELDFVRDYLALEALRLGTRLKVEWAIDEAALDDPIPPLTLQPLVENCIVHGIAPRVQGGTVRVEAQRRSDPPSLLLRVADDGAGCEWPPATRNPASRGVGLSSLQRRFEVDYEGLARMQVHSAPGAGFHVEILIPVQ
ncbi:MAG TPA: histidine kinase [Ideonella sp.]|nr:histidine kinase [Ideonella sp.]